MFEEHLRRWNLALVGAHIITPSSDLLPVLFDGLPAMLKIAKTEEEALGNRLMAWWGGRGSAAILAHDGPTLLMERATGHASLTEMARSGRDDEATRIICKVVSRLHARDEVLTELISLEDWFADLEASAHQHGGVLVIAAEIARDLMASQKDRVALHGDMHHGNVLDFGGRGWRAIDPKGLFGERTFDFVNVLRNPDPAAATARGRLAAQTTLIAAQARVDRSQLNRPSLSP